jgi:predicted RNase H-like HicB family nuclease
MRNEFTAIVEQDGPWYIAYCAEVPGANGQGETREECLANLREAIALVLEHRREESLRALPPNAKQELVWLDEARELPRHAEISNLLANRICRKLSIPDPPG